MEERNRKLLDTRIVTKTAKRELLSRDIKRPDGVWIKNWLGWNYALIDGEWFVTPDAPIFQSEQDGRDWLKA